MSSFLLDLPSDLAWRNNALCLCETSTFSVCSLTLLNASTIPRWGRPRLRECPRLTEAEKLYLTPRTQFSSPDSMASPCKHLSALPDSQLLPWIISELAAHSSSREGVGQPLTCRCMCPANSHETLPCRTRAHARQSCQLPERHHMVRSSASKRGLGCRPLMGGACGRNSALSLGPGSRPCKVGL